MPDMLAEALEAAIVFGELKPAERIIEEEIAEKYGVSRSPVREALRRLEADGLVVREDRRGAYVGGISRRDLDEIYLCRLELEGLAAREAALNWRDKALARLSKRLSEMDRSFDASDIRAYFIANVALTTEIHEVSGNRTLCRLLAGVGKQALRYRYFAYQSFPHLLNHSIEHNHELIEHIARRDGKEAMAVTRLMIQRSWDTIREYVADE
jgi:DNA-binding GntR family transcriptional regulator